MKLGMLAIAALAAVAVWWLSSRNNATVQFLSGGRGPIPMDPNVGAPAAAPATTSSAPHEHIDYNSVGLPGGGIKTVGKVTGGGLSSGGKIGITTVAGVRG